MGIDVIVVQRTGWPVPVTTGVVGWVTCLCKLYMYA